MEMTTDGAPLVTVVTATYHRPAVLRETLLSLCAQEFRDWESIVVGDGCSDGTAGVVEGLGDTRVRFHNLAERCGDQSGPNNAGVAMARGRLLAYLNHDDLWFPDHLLRCVAAIESTGADLVWPMLFSIEPGGAGRVIGATAGERYDPRVVVPASAWVFRRELATRIGPWRPARTLLNASSQDWLFRAHLAGADLRPLPFLGVVAVQSAYRPGSYADPSSEEASRWRNCMGRPQWREELLSRAAVAAAAEGRQLGLRARVSWLGFGLWMGLARWLRVHPETLRFLIRHGGRGGLIRHLNRVRKVG